MTASPTVFLLLDGIQFWGILSPFDVDVSIQNKSGSFNVHVNAKKLSECLKEGVKSEMLEYYECTVGRLYLYLEYQEDFVRFMIYTGSKNGRAYPTAYQCKVDRNEIPKVIEFLDNLEANYEKYQFMKIRQCHPEEAK